MISTSGHLIPKFPEVRFHRTRIFKKIEKYLKKQKDGDAYEDVLAITDTMQESFKNYATFAEKAALQSILVVIDFIQRADELQA